MKAALLSAFIFPGAGHFFLKKYIRAALLACTASLMLYWIITAAVERALDIVEQIQRGEVAADVATIAELVSRQSMGADAQFLNIATAVLLVAWLAGIVDSHRLGRLQTTSA